MDNFTSKMVPLVYYLLTWMVPLKASTICLATTLRFWRVLAFNDPVKTIKDCFYPHLNSSGPLSSTSSKEDFYPSIELLKLISPFHGILQGIVIENGHHCLRSVLFSQNICPPDYLSEDFAIFFCNDLKIREGLIEKAYSDIFHSRLQAVISSGNIEKVGSQSSYFGLHPLDAIFSLDSYRSLVASKRFEAILQNC